MLSDNLLLVCQLKYFGCRHSSCMTTFFTSYVHVYRVMKIPFDYVNKAIRMNQILSIIRYYTSAAHCFKPIGDPNMINNQN